MQVVPAVAVWLVCTNGMADDKATNPGAAVKRTVYNPGVAVGHGSLCLALVVGSGKRGRAGWFHHALESPSLGYRRRDVATRGAARESHYKNNEPDG